MSTKEDQPENFSMRLNNIENRLTKLEGVDAPYAIEVIPNPINLKVGQKIKPTIIVWTQDKRSLPFESVTIEAKGIVKLLDIGFSKKYLEGLSEGETTIKFSVSNGVSLAVPAVVNKAEVPLQEIAQIFLEPKYNSISPGDEIKLKVLVLDKLQQKIEGAQLRFESTDNSILTVDSEGNCKALREGQATAIVSAQNRVHATSTFAVSSKDNEVASIEVMPSSIELEFGDDNGKPVATSQALSITPLNKSGQIVAVEAKKIVNELVAEYVAGVVYSRGVGITNLVITAGNVSVSIPINVKGFVRQPPIIIGDPKPRLEEDFPGEHVADRINAAYRSFKNGEVGLVKALNGGELKDNIIVPEDCQLELKGFFNSLLGDRPRTYAGQAPFWQKHGSNIYSKKLGDTIVRENRNRLHQGNDSPAAVFVAYDISYNPRPERFNYTETTHKAKLSKIIIEGDEENIHDGGGGATVGLGNAWDWEIEDMIFNNTSYYAFGVGSTPDPSDTRDTTYANRCVIRNCEYNNLMSQTLGLINLDSCLFENHTFNGTGRRPYNIIAVDGDKIILDRPNGIANPGGGHISGANFESGLNTVNWSWVFEKVDPYTYRLLYQVNGSGTRVPGTEPKLGKYTGGAILYGTSQLAVHTDFEPNGSEKERAANNICRNFIYNLQNSWVGNNAFVFQPNAPGQKAKGSRIENMIILGSRKGFTYNGVQLSMYTENFTIDGLFADYCGQGLTLSGKNNTFRNMTIEASGTGGNTAIGLLGLTNSTFENINLNSKGRGVPDFSDGGGNSGNIYKNIFVDGVKYDVKIG
ncbi:MAG: hypothetical protein WBP82_09160 [Leuconostoc mesenteroides]